VGDTSISRVQTDPGKPGKTVNFEKNQGNLGKPREKIFFSCYSAKLREFIFKTLIETYWHNDKCFFLSFTLCMLYHS